MEYLGIATTALSWALDVALPVALVLVYWSYRATRSRGMLFLSAGLGLWFLNWAVHLLLVPLSPWLYPVSIDPHSVELVSVRQLIGTIAFSLLRLTGAVLVAIGGVKAATEWSQVQPGGDDSVGR